MKPDMAEGFELLDLDNGALCAYLCVHCTAVLARLFAVWLWVCGPGVVFMGG
jgi:hypothetical protein